MRFVARFCLVALCVAALFNSPAMAAHRKVLGVVLQTDHARLDNANAVMGADIYSCDMLETDESGVLRARVASGQVYLSALSAAQLEDDVTAIQVLALRGTVGFSSPAAGEITIRTPAGIVRGTGAGAAGQVTFTGPKELLITAMHGDLLLDNGGELRTIPEGKSATVTFEDNLEPGCHDEAAADQQPQHPLVRHKIGFYIVAGAAVGIPVILLWHSTSESDSQPPK
ncbi:MAG TPA: hypothetical protein VN822_07160 [Candidatus Acidoferrales bacterium]|nr:hypothetical protein [Candidatus Acidoferrales bacterium]